MQYSLGRLKIKDQISQDPLKLMALGERALLNIVLTLLVFISMQQVGLVSHFLVGAVCCGVLVFLAITLKTMYYDNALAQLELSPEADLYQINAALHGMGYTEISSGEYSKDKKMFSILRQCKSERILLHNNGKLIAIKGPYEPLEKLLTLVT